MEYRFTAFGHENVTGKHKNTLEFTKDKELRLEGDCILGVKADFNLFRLRKIVEKGVKLKLTISADGVSDFVVFEPNPDFNDSHEIVVRKSEFNSKRTFGVRADKACAELKRELVEKLKDDNQKIEIIIVTL